jgi:hypothetical protein
VDAFRALSTGPDGILEISTSTSTAQPFTPGSSVNFFVNVSDASPVTNATVTGGIVDGNLLSFVNNGVSPDAIAADGIYSAAMNVPSTGTNFTVRVVISAPGKRTATNSTTFQILQPPANDRFANRATLAGTTVATSASNVGATKETGEPAHASNAGGKSVWWTWTATSAGPVRVTTMGSDFDTTLGVYTGTTVGALTLIASDDDGGGWPASALTFTAVAETSYQIAVDGFDDGFGAGAGSGNIRLSIVETNRLRLLPPERLGGAGYRIWIAAADGTPLNASRASRIEVHALASVNETLSTGTRLNAALNLFNGRFWLDDFPSMTQATRYYRVIERVP